MSQNSEKSSMNFSNVITPLSAHSIKLENINVNNVLPTEESKNNDK